MSANLSAAKLRENFESNLYFLNSSINANNNKHVVGIDPSLTNTSVSVNRIGWNRFIYDDSPEEIRDTTNRPKTYKRIDLTREFLLRVFKKFPSRLTTIEGYSYGSVQNRELMGEVGGMIRLNIFYDHHDLVGPVIVVGPTQLKKYILGSAQNTTGKKTKQLIILNVFKKLNITVDNDNQADAIVLSLIAKDIISFLKIFGNKNFSCDKDIREFLKNGWIDSPFKKYEWEVICSIITSKCDKKIFDFSRKK